MGHGFSERAYVFRAPPEGRSNNGNNGAVLPLGRSGRPRSVAALSVPVAASIIAVAATAFQFVHPVSLTDPTGRAVIETALMLFALAAAWLVRAQFAYSRRLDDLLMLTGLLTFGMIHGCAYAVPAAAGVSAASAVAAAGLWGELVVAAVLAAAALARSDRGVASDRTAWVIAVGLSIGGVAVSELGSLLTHGALLGSAARPGPGMPVRPVAAGLSIVSAALFLLAAVALLRRARHDRDEASSILAAAAVLLAAARLHYLALPASGLQSIAPRDGLRFVAATLLLLAAARQELSVAVRAAHSAAIAERRRVARDLHDGLAQDLAYIATHGAKMGGAVGDANPVVIAARHALAISRGTLADLSRDPRTGTREALEAIAADLGRRFGVSVLIDADVERELEPHERENVIRIAREAIANACQHGGAEHVTVSLKRTPEWLSLRVTDDGCGIGGPTGSPVAEGFGLTSMRERAAALGGRLSIRQRRDGRTELEFLVH